MNFSCLDNGALELDDSGQLVLVENQDEVKQFLIQKLRAFRGEWFLDITLGVPYYESILVKNPNPTLIEALLVDEILATPGTLEILEFELDLDKATRELSLNLKVLGEDGIISFNEVIGA